MIKVTLLPTAPLHNELSDYLQLKVPITEIMTKAVSLVAGKDSPAGIYLLLEAQEFQKNGFHESAQDHYFLALSYLEAAKQTSPGKWKEWHAEWYAEQKNIVIPKFKSSYPDFSARERFGLPRDTISFTAEMVSTEPSASLVKYTDRLQLSPQRYYNTTSGMLKDFLKRHEGFVYSGDIAKLL